MINNLILLDKNTNTEKNAQIIVKFKYYEKDYLVYCVDENDQNSQILVSRLVLNSEGKYFIEDITTEEKSKLSNIIYNIVILLPSDFEKGNEFQVLTDNLYSKFSVKLLNGLPKLEIQEYYSNCSIAITSKILVNNAINLYSEKLKNYNDNISSDVPTWTAPMEVTAPTPINNDVEVATPISIVPNLDIKENNNVQNVDDSINKSLNEGNNSAVIVPVENNDVSNSNVLSSESVILNDDSFGEIVLNGPQVDKLAIVSDPSLGIMQTNAKDNKKAGFANTKYVVIGTVCLVLAIAVIITAYILIKNLG